MKREVSRTEKRFKIAIICFWVVDNVLEKIVLNGFVKAGRRRSRQKKRWKSNIAKWTGLKFCDAVREAENKTKWRERVATSVAPQRSLTTG